MLMILIAGAVLALAAISLEVALVIRCFKVSGKLGVLSIVAPLLLASGMGLLALVSHETALAERDAVKLQAQGDKEMDAQIDDLENADNVDLGL